MLDHRVGCADDIGFLEGVGANGVHADLAGDDHHRHGIHVCVGDRGDHVRGARAGRDDAHADLTGRYGIAFSRMTCGLFVAHQHKTEAGFIIDCIVYRQNRAAWNAENILDAQIFQRTYQRFGAGHLLAVNNGLLFSGCGCLGMPLNACRGVGNTMFPLIFARGTFLQGYAAAFRCTQSAEPHHRESGAIACGDLRIAILR